MAKKMTAKQTDREIERVYKIHAEGLSINIMDIGKVFALGRAAVVSGASLDDAMRAAVAQYCGK